MSLKVKIYNMNTVSVIESLVMGILIYAVQVNGLIILVTYN